MIRKTLIALLLALALPATSSAWQSDTFQSPSGNLICKYRYNFNAITCGAFSSQLVVHMTSRGRPVQGQRLSWDGTERWPVLGYGLTWNRGGSISCRSLTVGMRCTNQAGWYFQLARSGVVVGRFGEGYYKLPN